MDACGDAKNRFGSKIIVPQNLLHRFTFCKFVDQSLYEHVDGGETNSWKMFLF